MDDGVEEKRRIEVLHVHLLADQHQSRLLKIDSLSFPFARRQTGLGDFVDNATRMMTAEIESFAVLFVKEGQRESVSSLYEFVGVTRWTNETEANFLGTVAK
jgi:hypothetical protein